MRKTEPESEPEPLDLHERFGDKYHVHRDQRDPSRHLLPCRHGCTIHSVGPDHLAVEVNGGRTGLVGKLKALGPEVEDHDDDAGTSERKTLKFPAHMFNAVANLVSPRKRRQLSEAHKALLDRAGAGSRFRSSGPLPVPGRDDEDTDADDD